MVNKGLFHKPHVLILYDKRKMFGTLEADEVVSKQIARECGLRVGNL